MSACAQEPASPRGPYAHHEEFEGPAIPSAAEPAESYEEEAGEHYGSGRLSAAVATVEGEFAFGYTKLSGEWIHTILETPDRDVVARGWMAQAVRTLSPRWFVAVRGAHVSSPRLQPSVLAASALIERRLTFDSLEDVVGYRVAPELTVRLGHTAIKRYTTPAWDHQLGVSLVWSRRLW